MVRPTAELCMKACGYIIVPQIPLHEACRGYSCLALVLKSALVTASQ